MRPPGKTHMPPAKSSAVLRRINSVSSPPSASRATITVAAGIGGTGAREGPERAGGLDGPDDVVSRTGRGYDLHAQAISVRAPDVLRHVVTDVLRLVVGSRAQACTSECAGARRTGEGQLAKGRWPGGVGEPPPPVQPALSRPGSARGRTLSRVTAVRSARARPAGRSGERARSRRGRAPGSSCGRHPRLCVPLGQNRSHQEHRPPLNRVALASRPHATYRSLPAEANF